MSEKVQLSPGRVTREGLVRSPLQIRWSNPSTDFDKMTFFRSWLVYDSDFELTRSRGRLNWNAIGGLALMFSISAASWAGVALLIERILK